MKKVYGLLLCFLVVLLLVSCSGVFDGNMGYYYQQQGKVDSSDLEEEIPPLLEEEDDETTETLPEGATLYTMFDVLQADGTINQEIFSKFPQEIQDTVNASLKDIAKPFVTAELQNKVINVNKIDNYVPNVSYIDGTWSVNGSEYTSVGSDFIVTAPANVTSKDVMYYMYKGINPMYESTHSSNTATYGDNTETRMNRFMFYRFTASAVGVKVDTHLVAVDTYTKLIFAHSYPGDFDKLGNPTEWASVGAKFYEKDPIGYVAADGTFTMHSWYTENLSGKKGKVTREDIPSTGKSPYAHVYSSAGAVLQEGTYEATTESGGKIRAELKADKTTLVTLPNETVAHMGQWLDSTITLNNLFALTASSITSNSFVLDMSVMAVEGIGIHTFTKVIDDPDAGGNTEGEGNGSNPGTTEPPVESDVDLHAGIYAGTVTGVGELQAELKEDGSFSLIVPLSAESSVSVVGTWGENIINAKVVELGNDLVLTASNISITSFDLDLTGVLPTMGKPTFRKVGALQAGVYKGDVGGSIGEIQAELTRGGTFSLDIGILIKGTWSDTSISVAEPKLDFEAINITPDSTTADGVVVPANFTLDLTVITGMGMPITTFTKIGESTGSGSGEDTGGEDTGGEDTGGTEEEIPPPPPPTDPEEEEETEPVPEGAIVYTMFDVLKSNGEIDETVFENFSQTDKDVIMSILPTQQHNLSVDTMAFENKLINISKIADYVPSLSFIDGTWDIGDSEDSKGGNGFPITGVPTNPTSSEIKYFRSKGAVPSIVQGLPTKINTETFGNGSERKVERFMFYRFTGKAVVELNNMLVAVDTYTNLIFAFAYPYAFSEILGNKNPSAWATLDKPFYTYDPIGYVAANGSFNIESWYNSALTNKKGEIKSSDIQSTGKSPYSYSVMLAGESANTYLNSLTDKTFKYRGGEGVSDILETYTFNETGMEITQTNTKWGTETETEFATFTFDSATSETEGSFSVDGKTVSLVVSGEGNLTLTIDDVIKNLVLAENYSDVEPFFIDKVKGKSYTYRSDTAGNSEILFVHEFSDDGRTLTKRQSVWRGLSTPVTENFDYTGNGNQKTATYDGTTYTLGDDDLLIGSEVVGQLNFTDKGPKFVDRVKGQTFAGKGWTYEFGDDGKTIKVKGKNWIGIYVEPTYTHIGNGSQGDGGYTSAAYEEIPGTVYGVKLSTEHGIIDDTIRWTPSSWGGNSTTPIPEATEKPATIDAEPGENVIFSNLNIAVKSIKNIGMKSQKYKTLDITFTPVYEDVEEAHLSYDVRSAVYDKASAPSLDTLTSKGKVNDDMQGLILGNQTNTVGIGQTHNLNGNKDYTLSNITMTNSCITLDSKFAAIAYWGAGTISPSEYTRVYNDYNIPDIVFKFDTQKQGFVVDTEKSNLTNTTVTEDFVLTLGESKVFKITYNNVSELIYTLTLTESSD